MKITDGMEGGTGGIENVAGSDYIVSCNVDVGYGRSIRMPYAPTFWKNNIVAYELR